MKKLIISAIIIAVSIGNALAKNAVLFDDKGYHTILSNTFKKKILQSGYVIRGVVVANHSFSADNITKSYFTVPQKVCDAEFGEILAAGLPYVEGNDFSIFYTKGGGAVGDMIVEAICEL